MTTRVMINLREDERQALVTLSQNERRDPRDQAVMLIRQGLIELGYIPQESPKPTKEDADCE